MGVTLITWGLFIDRNGNRVIAMDFSRKHRGIIPLPDENPVRVEPSGPVKYSRRSRVQTVLRRFELQAIFLGKQCKDYDYEQLNTNMFCGMFRFLDSIGR